MADLLPADLACALQFRSVQSELPDPCSLCLFPGTRLHVLASRLHLPHSDLSCPCFLFSSPLCFCLNPPPFCSHSVQKQLLCCSASGNSPSLQCSHGNTLTTHPLLPVWDRQPVLPAWESQPGPESQNPQVKDSQTPARGFGSSSQVEAAHLPQPCCLLQQQVHVVQQFLESCCSQAGSSSPWNSKAVAWTVLLQAIESSGCVMVQSTQWLQRACFAIPTACSAQFGEDFPCSCSGISLPGLLSHSVLRKASCLVYLVPVLSSLRGFRRFISYYLTLGGESHRVRGSCAFPGVSLHFAVATSKAPGDLGAWRFYYCCFLKEP